MCYLWVQGSLFAGQRGIDFLSMSAPLFGAQREGDNSKLIHRWIRINIRAANINSQQKKKKEEMQSVAKCSTQTKDGGKTNPWPKSISALSYECIIFTGSCRCASAFSLISVLIFIMIFYRSVSSEGSWRAACCFWLFSPLSPGFRIWIWIFII